MSILESLPAHATYIDLCCLCYLYVNFQIHRYSQLVPKHFKSVFRLFYHHHHHHHHHHHSLCSYNYSRKTAISWSFRLQTFARIMVPSKFSSILSQPLPLTSLQIICSDRPIIQLSSTGLLSIIWFEGNECIF
jgi:hypothetical protein